MASINPVQAYQQILSMTLEDRSSGYQDLVSNNNALTAVLNRKGLWESYSGPRIRQTLQIDKSPMQWYGDYDFLQNSPIELFNDAWFAPKWAVVPISLSMQEIWNNQGENQILPVLRNYILAAERALADGLDEAMYGDGSANGGMAIGGLDVAIPIVDNAGTYGGISRTDHAIWRTQTYDAATDFPDIVTPGQGVNSTNIRSILLRIVSQHTRRNQAPDLFLMSQEHYEAYDAATVAIQRITRDTELGKLGFTTLEYIGANRRAEIVLAGGIGSAMPANTTFGINTDSFRMRFNPAQNFDKLFDGDGQMPINQAALAQFIGWGGELTVTNPLFNFRLIDTSV